MNILFLATRIKLIYDTLVIYICTKLNLNYVIKLLHVNNVKLRNVVACLFVLLG